MGETMLEPINMTRTFKAPIDDPERFQRLCVTIATQQLKKVEYHQKEAEKWLAWGERVKQLNLKGKLNDQS